MKLIERLKGRTTFIVGSRKNAGKTTFLNYALAEMGKGRAACLSVGVDGETVDQVFGTPKPRVRLRPGDLAVVPEASLPGSDAGLEILQVYPAAATGRPVLVRARRSGAAEITGPGTNSGLADMLRDISGAGPGTVFIDGAVDRITQAAADAGGGMVYVTRVEPSSLASAADAVNLLAEAAACPAEPAWAVFFEGGATPAEKGTFPVKGALTAAKAGEIPAGVKKLVLEDLTKLFITYREWTALRRRTRIFFARQLDLKAIVANLYNVEPRDFEAKLTAEARVRLAYNPYISR